MFNDDAHRTPSNARFAARMGVERAIENYQPRTKNARLQWDGACRDFTVAAAFALKLDEPERAANAMRTLARFVLWCHAQGLDLDREVVFHPDVVERYIGTCGALAPSSQATFRSNLRRFGPLLTKRAPWVRRPAALRPHGNESPYSRTEVDRILEICGDQRTTDRLSRLSVIVRLVIGAGLKPQEVWLARPGDIVSQLGLVCVVTRGAAARVVPITAPHDAALQDLTSRFTGGKFWGVDPHSTGRTRIGEVVGRADLPPDCPQIRLHRLRATWILRHLEAGINLAGIARMAGITSINPFESPLRVLESPPDNILFPAMARVSTPSPAKELS